MRPNSFQTGAALLILLTSIVLVTASFLLYRLNNTSLKIENQQHTVKVLAEAKAALIGFAATYAERNPGQPSGFLPCPDSDGDGSSDPPCTSKGHNVIGLFPWRTLGLPFLRDSSNTCLWYAVSGNYLDNPKSPLSSITPGLFIIEDAGGNTVAGSTEADQAIAVIFAPGLPLAEQNRTPNTSICGTNSLQAVEYLDTLNAIDNATGKGTLAARPAISANFLTTSAPLEVSTFVAASPAYEITNMGGTMRVNQGKRIFNDTLAWITPQDYQHVYKRMEYWVAERVRQCVNEYGKQYKAYAKVHYETEINAFIATQTTKINQFITDYQNSHETNNPPYSSEYTSAYTDIHGTSPAYDPQIAAVSTSDKYPWAAILDETNPIDYADDTGHRFGRLASPPFYSSNADNGLMSKENIVPYWAMLKGERCFDETAGFNNNQWGWWSAWKEIVFFAMDISFAPSQPTFLWVDTFRSSTLATVTAPTIHVTSALVQALTLDSSRTEFIVLVAGRPLAGQVRTTISDQGKVENYLEGDNQMLDNFTSGDLTTTFNDTVCSRAQCIQR